MFGPIHSVVFDFDGTLVDTMASVIRGLSTAIEGVTGKLISTDDLVRSFGPAPQEVLEKWVPKEQVPQAFQLWLDFEKNLGPSDIRPFSGAEELLEHLKKKDKGLGIFTGRDRQGTLRILEAHGWLGRFFDESQLTCGDDGLKPKPSPELLIALLERKKWVPEQALMVGDHPYDMMAGRAAGTRTAAALWDLPPGPASARARFRAAWQRWDQVDCDLRLESLLSLMDWV